MLISNSTFISSTLALYESRFKIILLCVILGRQFILCLNKMQFLPSPDWLNKHKLNNKVVWHHIKDIIITLFPIKEERQCNII